LIWVGFGPTPSLRHSFCIVAVGRGVAINKEEQSLVDQLQELRPRLRSFAYTLTQSEDMADEAAQETVSRAWQHLHQWRGESFESWVFRILRSYCANEFRRLDVRAKAKDRLEIMAERDSETPIKARVIELDVNRALAELSVDHRAVVHLVVKLKRTYREAAEILDIPIGTVESRLFRAREILKKRLRAYAPAKG